MTNEKETIIKSALKYLVKMQIEEGSVGFAVDNDPDHDCCWDVVLAWLEAQPCEDKIGDFIKHKIDYLEDLASIETNEGRWREEEKYLYAISVLEEVVEFINTGGCEE